MRSLMSSRGTDDRAAALSSEILSRADLPERRLHSSRTVKGKPTSFEEGILVSHEYFRWMHREMLKVMDVFDPLFPGRDFMPSDFLDWYDQWYVVCVHGHHDAEELVVNPYLRMRGQAMGKDASADPSKRVMADHPELMTKVKAISSWRSKFREDVDAKKVEAFKAAVRELVEHMEVHFAEEEEDYPAWYKAVEMTEESNQELVNLILDNSAYEEKAKSFAGAFYNLYAWAGPETTNERLAQVPLVPKLLCSYLWMPDFLANCKGTLERLQRCEPSTKAICC